MIDDAIIRPLKSLAEVQGGHPFRGSVPDAPQGNTAVIQIRDANPETPIPWGELARTHLDLSKRPNWLRPGDVVFVARGPNNYAVCLRDVPVQAVCSQYFFLLRPKTSGLLPEFLAWQINRGPARTYLRSNAEGSDQLSIRRAVLESMPIAVPPIDVQRTVIALADAAAQEKRRFAELLRNREQQLEAIATDLFAQHSIQHSPQYPTVGNKHA